MEKNTIIAVVLSFFIIVASVFVQVKFVAPRQMQKAAEQQAIAQIEKEKKEAQLKEEMELVSAAGETSESAENTEGKAAEPVVAIRDYEIKTNKFVVVLTNRGGDVKSLKLIEHKDKDSGDGVEMVKNITSSNRAFSLAFGGNSEEALNEPFKVTQKDNNTIIFSRDYEVKDSAGKTHKIKLGKRYTFAPDDYVFKLDVSILADDENTELDLNGAAYSLRTAPQIGPSFDKKNRYEVRQYVALNGTKKFDKAIADKTFNKEYKWAGIAGKYFTMIVKPNNPESMLPVCKTINEGDGAVKLENAQLYLTRGAIKSKSVNDTYYVYVGPRSESELIKYNDQSKNAWGISKAEFNQALQTSGFFFWIEVILKWALEKIYLLVKNWGVAIIVLTFLLKIVLFPLNKKSAMGSLKMQELQPKMQELQSKYANDRQKLGMEMQKLYKEAGYNPMSGCLPMIIQMFILFALYNVFNNYFEFRGASFISGWIDDLSTGDSIWTWNKNIFLISSFTMNNLRILPFVYTGSQLLNGKITQFGNAGGTTQAQMKFMIYGMPIMFFFLFYNVPSGLLLYWTVSNILQIGQQLIINSVMKKKRSEIAASKPVNANALKFKNGKKKTR